MEIKVLTTGDIHMGKVSTQLEGSHEHATAIQAWHRIVNAALEHSVDAVALTGDIIDRNNSFFESIGPLQRGLDRLREAGIPVFAVSGNHDYDVLPDATAQFENVHLLGSEGDWGTEILQTKNGNLRLVGRSFADWRETTNPFDRWTDIPPESIPTLGLLHCDLDTPESVYAPVSTYDFQGKNVDFWALGHIHKPAQYSGPSEFMYPGSPQALSPKETGMHGAVLLTFHGKSRVETKFIPISTVQYETVSIDLGEIGGSDFRLGEVPVKVRKAAGEIERQSNIRELVLDVNLSVRTNHYASFKKQIADQSAQLNFDLDNTHVSVRKWNLDLRPLIGDKSELAKQKSPVGILAKTILDLESGTDNDHTRKLREAWKEKLKSLEAAGTYHGYTQTTLYDSSAWEPDQILLAECNRLLAELLAQQSEP